MRTLSGSAMAPEQYPSPLQRLFLAFVAFFAVLLHRDFAYAVRRLRAERRAGLPLDREPQPGALPAQASEPPPAASAGRPAPAPAPASPAAAPAPAAAAGPAPAAAIAAPAPAAAAPAEVAPAPEVPALRVLAALQREGRLVDFIEESLDGFSDAQIGAAARTVHAGCKKAIEEWFRLEPVLREPEGATVTVPTGFDPAQIRLTGQVVGAPPFRGAVRHHGWRAREVRVPPAPPAQDARIVAPAEVEL